MAKKTKQTEAKQIEIDPKPVSQEVPIIQGNVLPLIVKLLGLINTNLNEIKTILRDFQRR